MSNRNYHECGAAAIEADGFYGCDFALHEEDEGNFWLACVTHDYLVRTVEVRKATVDATTVGWGSDPLKVVNAYLPRTFQATREGDVITIIGTDDHGWTLDEYVIPRLASAMIYAQEVK